MNASLNVNDYLETVFLMLGWIINNSIWDVLNKTGLAAFPFAAMIVSEFHRARREGDDEGNKGVLSLNRIEVHLIAMIACYCFTCLPLLTLSINPVNTIQRTDGSGNMCSVAMIGQGKWQQNTLNSIDGQTAKIPVWWAFLHAVSKGLTNSTVAAIPCMPDMQAVITEIDTQPIKDPGLQREVSDFQQQCFGAARNKLFQQGGVIDKDKSIDSDWIGSNYFVNTPGYYDAFYSRNPVAGFPYDDERDKSRPNTGPGEPGYPTCRQWWADESSGLRSRLHDQIDTNTWDRFRSVFTFGGAEDYAIRRMVSPRSGAANGNQSRAFSGYRGIDGSNVGEMSAADVVSAGVGAVGGAMVAVPGKAAIDMVKQTLPILQAILIMAAIICLPFIMTISAYSFKAAGTASFGLFSIWFLTFWWELARWLNSNLVSLIYSSDAAKMGLLSALENGYDKMVISLVEWSTFLILPTIWVGILAWSGAKTGGMISQAMSTGTAKADQAGNKGGNKAMKGAKP